MPQMKPPTRQYWKRGWCLLLGMMALLLMPLSWSQTAAEDSKQSTADLQGFRTTVAPFFQAHCTKCHGARKQAGKLALHTIQGNLLAGADLEKWQAVAARLTAGEMPPEGEPQPDPAAIQKVTDWIEHELSKAGKSSAVAAGSLQKGNHVPHELLFGPKATATFQAPPRLWRISPAIYEEMIKKISRNAKVSQPFAIPAGDGFKDVAGAFPIDESSAAQLLRNAEIIVSHQLGQVKGGRLERDFAALLDENKPPSRQQIETAIRREFNLVLHRTPAAAEMERFVQLYEKNVKTGGSAVGARTTLMAVFLMPEANFRLELGQGPADSQGRRMLAPRELAFAIAYALTDRPPDAALLKAADSGKLAATADVAREVQRLLNDARVKKPRILRFFHEYFGYPEAVTVFKDTQVLRPLKISYRPEQLVADTDRLVNDILARDQNVLVELLTTNKSFVSSDAKRKMYLLYNLSAVPSRQPVSLPADQRCGILTQPSWLAAFSDNKDNHAIRRGKWICERLLGGTVPALPISVDAQLPDDPARTLRQRMAVTEQQYCWQCHQKMNPLGLTFENFDGFGRHRSTELDQPVDASGYIKNSGDQNLDGDYRNSLDMIRRLAKSERVRQVFVRHAFRYWLGREETPGDARSLQAADRAYVESGGSMKALITALLTSEAFLYRTVVRAGK